MSLLFEKELKSNPDFISLPEDHRYKIEVYANEMYADVGYVELENQNIRFRYCNTVVCRIAI